MAQHRLSPGDHERTIEVAAGDTLLIELPELATAGYEWVFDDLGDDLALVSRTLSPGGAVGASAVCVFEVRVLRPTARDLAVRQYRSWEGPTRAVSTLRVRLHPGT